MKMNKSELINEVANVVSSKKEAQASVDRNSVLKKDCFIQNNRGVK